MVLLHPDFGEHLLNALIVRLGATLSRLFSLFLPPSTNLIPSYPSQMTGTTGATRESKNFFITCGRKPAQFEVKVFPFVPKSNLFLIFFVFFFKLTLDSSIECYINLENEKRLHV